MRKDLFGRKFHFHDFVGFMRGRFPFPMANRIDRSLSQHGVSAFYFGAFYRTIRRDECVHFHDTLQRHISSKFRIDRSRVLHDFALAAILGLRQRRNYK